MSEVVAFVSVGLGYFLAKIEPVIKPVPESRKRICNLIHENYINKKGFGVSEHVYCLKYGAESAVEKYNLLK